MSHTITLPSKACESKSDGTVQATISPDHLTPEMIAHWVKHTTLIQLGEVQTLLAKDGLSLSVQTGTIEIYEPIPGEETLG